NLLVERAEILLIEKASRSPSPRPSPAGRGRCCSSEWDKILFRNARGGVSRSPGSESKRAGDTCLTMLDLMNDTQTKPDLQIGSRVAVTIHDIAFGGEGVARLDDFVIFVSFVLVGEEVEVEITELKKRFARAKLIRVIRASPHRAVPECRYFGNCGGCQ